MTPFCCPNPLLLPTTTQVPENMQNNPHLASSPALAFHQALVMTNNQLHRSGIDDQLSGTTAILALVRGR
jgi:hypothetical protein